MKKIMMMIVLYLALITLDSCSKRSENVSANQHSVRANQNLKLEVNSICAKYKLPNEHSPKQLGTWAGVGLDIMGGLGGAALGAGVGSFCLGLSFGLAASSYGIPVHYTTTDPCGNDVTYNVPPHIVHAYFPSNSGSYNSSNTSSSQTDPISVSLSNLKWFTTYQSTPALQTPNPFNSSGFFHNFLLSQTPCNSSFFNASPSGRYDMLADQINFFLADNNFTYDANYDAPQN